MFDDYDLPSGYRDADLEMRELEAAGDAAYRGGRRMLELYRAGELARAARACKHGYRYGLRGTAAKDAGDPRYGQGGDRCIDCGSWVEDAGGIDRVFEPCELEPREIAEERKAAELVDEHESGQLRIGVAGDALELFPLDDERIPPAGHESTPAELEQERREVTGKTRHVLRLEAEFARSRGLTKRERLEQERRPDTAAVHSLTCDCPSCRETWHDDAGPCLCGDRAQADCLGRGCALERNRSSDRRAPWRSFDDDRQNDD